MYKTWLQLNSKMNVSLEQYETLEEAKAAAQIIHENSHKPVAVVELKVVEVIK